ncbi:hypothetical protein PIB30_101567 [Stylosanthes scabra]|uniref:Uncharacterized protein n=1 Tax=Stylosanthes scabra TaxID=79078 RepID=A0ABU6ZW19_9FABA|nr:hypothetical protein [Stylosanthes scabra]
MGMQEMASKKHKRVEDNDLENVVSSTELKVPRKSRVRFAKEQDYADEVLSYMKQLLNDEDCFLLGHLEAKRVRGPTLLKDIWNMPPGKTIYVQFNKRNQAIRITKKAIVSSYSETGVRFTI